MQHGLKTMKNLLTLITLFCAISTLDIFSTLPLAEDSETSETPKYTEEQYQKLRETEEKYKDNPAVLTIIDRLKTQYGMTESAKVKQDSEPPPITAHGKVITQGPHHRDGRSI